MSTIGQKIRNRRVEIGMSVDELAKRLGKNRATIYRYESDEIENFPVAVIPPLAEVLGVSPAYLMGWEDEKKTATPEDDGLSEIITIFAQLSEENRAKLLELSRLYLSAQHNTEESQ